MTKVITGFLIAVGHHYANLELKFAMESNLPEDVLETSEIGITGMTCDHCARRVEKALIKAGAESAVVDRPAARARVRFDPRKTAIPQLHEALLRSGYPPA